MIRKMGVSNRIREIEREIDAEIRALPIWYRSKATVLTDLMQSYRDVMEILFLEFLFFETHASALDLSADHVGTLFVQENRHRAGTLWALKWASEFCPESGSVETSTPDELFSLTSLGADYESFVDTLKYANHDLIEIKIDEQSRTINCYEGQQATQSDSDIVYQQRLTAPASPQISLTDDSDQVTSRWTAGDYRRVITDFASYAADKENEIFVDAAYLGQPGKSAASIPQPTLVWLDRPIALPDCDVFDDLVLHTSADPGSNWKLVALLDTPIVKVGDKYCALSSDLKALSRIDDYMLRLAGRVDERQYTLAAGLREQRMITRCRETFERCTPSWTVRDSVRYSNPEQEADILASRNAVTLVLELKSTLRPETPWESFKRNESIIYGVKQAKGLIDRGVAEYGFVISDGYRGDYSCWAEALSTSTPIGTLDDLAQIASDHVGAVSALKGKVGITGDSLHSHERLPDREANLGGWKFRLLDMEAPQE